MEPLGVSNRQLIMGLKIPTDTQAQPMTSLMTAALLLLQTIVNIIRLSFDIWTVWISACPVFSLQVQRRIKSIKAEITVLSVAAI